MNRKLSGIIFVLFGIGLIGNSSHDLYYSYLKIDFATIKSALFLLLGISSCIYGYKQFNYTLKKDNNSNLPKQE